MSICEPCGNKICEGNPGIFCTGYYILTVERNGKSRKTLPALTLKETVDRLAVLMSEKRIMKLLGVPQMPSVTGKRLLVFTLLGSGTYSNASDVCSLTHWQVILAANQEPVLSLSKSATVLICLACRHQIHELIVAKCSASSMWNLQTVQTLADSKLFQGFSE